MSRKIVSRRLTTCRVVETGRAIRLDFLDRGEQPVSIELPFEQAQSVVMTLPQLLSKALELRAGKPGLKYVFDLGRWSIETPTTPRACCSR